MRRLFFKTSAILLVFILIIATITSCKLGVHKYNPTFPDDYTGGFGDIHTRPAQYFWVETAEEAEAAIELLKSHNSTFEDEYLYTCDSELFDTKYCFMFFGHSDMIKFGEDPFDRGAKDIHIRTYVFFEDVTIEEINYSLLGRFDAYEVSVSDRYYHVKENISADKIVDSGWKNENNRYLRQIGDEENTLLAIISQFYDDTDEVEINMTDECISDILVDGTFIELNLDKGGSENK